MRKSFVALALLVGAIAMVTTSALAFEGSDQNLKLANPTIAKMQLSRASRLGTSADGDTFFVGHMASWTPTADNPWCVGVAPYRPGASADGTWDFDSFNGGLVDSMQGFTPVVRPNHRTLSSGNLPDEDRPWMCLDWGNRLNRTPYQGRTVGVVGVWHVDGGGLVGANGQVLSASPMWNPLTGSASAWCGLRAGKDVAYLDDVSRGGTGNPINGDMLWGEFWNAVTPTAKNFPGYAARWDQMLYRDVRVAAGASLTVSFQYQTDMSIDLDTGATTAAGWFNVDPLSMTQGPVGTIFTNFISASAAETQPVDSFMVYVGKPTNPTAVQYSDMLDQRPMYDMQRRWFSEVLDITAPVYQLRSVGGVDSTYKSAPYSQTLPTATVATLLAGQAPDGSGIVRVVFRSKTNKNFDTEHNTYNSNTVGAVLIDNVSITGCAVPVSSGFEAPGEINNTIEGPNSSTPGPAVGEGYALSYWHSTGKPPKHYSHTHPLAGGDIAGDGSNVYSPLPYADVCGPPDSPARFCNVASVVVSTCDHDNNEAAGGMATTPFLENVQGILSPSINLVTPDVGVNNMGIDRVHAQTDADKWIASDQYRGIFDANSTGNVWGYIMYAYPARQANGADVWSDAGYGEWVYFWETPSCFTDWEPITAQIHTTSATGYPDSVRLCVFREQRCISFDITVGCSPTGGHYYDNVVYVLPPPSGGGGAGTIAVGIWDWYNDAFPANETSGLPGVPAAFDTCGAHIFTGYNIAPMTGDTKRFCVPGDTLFFNCATSDPSRLDIVFRVYPGPGNYMTRGNKASGLRQVPKTATLAVAGDNSFWGQYMADPGLFSKGNHASGWDASTWNSVRIDTLEKNMFPVSRRGNLSQLSPTAAQTSLHELEPKFPVLGILKNRCFLIDTSATAPVEDVNITCSTVPTWLTTLPQSYTGYDGQQQTREYTKIFPDGLFTGGTHIEYFIRMSPIAEPATFKMVPDTNMIVPQGDEGSWDGHRWQEFSILPDRWKDALYGGIGNACMLVVDGADRRGPELPFVSLADSIGLTKASKYGAHNGWHCTAAYNAPSDGSDNFWNETDCGTNPAIAVWAHGGSPGSVWDMYQAKASESLSTGVASLGDRLAPRTNMKLLTGKQGRHGPTPEMLRVYYKLVFWMSGDLSSGVLGPEVDKGADDCNLLIDFLTYNAVETAPRGLWASGDGFIESNSLYGSTNIHTTIMTTYLASALRDASYYALQGSAWATTWAELTPTSVITTGGDVYGIMNSCLLAQDVLTPNVAIPSVAAASYYEPIGVNGPYVSGVWAPSTTTHPYITLADGFDFTYVQTAGMTNTMGRLQYFMNVLGNTFFSVCPFVPELTVDVPTNTVRDVNFLSNVWGNPMVAGGKASVHFGLAKADRVEIKVYDVTGRLVKSLADRDFDAGEHTLVWDGTNDQGRTVSRGVYFTQVKYVNSGFVDAKKVTVLK